MRDEVASSAATDLTHAVMQMGQFLDHDLDLSVGGEGSTACNSIRYLLNIFISLFIHWLLTSGN